MGWPLWRSPLPLPHSLASFVGCWAAVPGSSFPRDSHHYSLVAKIGRTLPLHQTSTFWMRQSVWRSASIDTADDDDVAVIAVPIGWCAGLTIEFWSHQRHSNFRCLRGMRNSICFVLNSLFSRYFSVLFACQLHFIKHLRDAILLYNVHLIGCRNNWTRNSAASAPPPQHEHYFYECTRCH